MIVKILAANARAVMGVGIITPAKYSGIREIVREEMAQPVDTIVCRPCSLAMTIETMDGNNTKP